MARKFALAVNGVDMSSEIFVQAEGSRVGTADKLHLKARSCVLACFLESNQKSLVSKARGVTLLIEITGA